MAWLQPLWDFFVDHLYAAVFVATIVDATGLPFPGRLLLIAAGAYAVSDGSSVVALILLGAAGAAIGDHLWYAAGRFGGERLLSAICRLTLNSADCRELAQGYFRSFGAPTIMLARFSTAVRIFTAALAASKGFGYLRFLVYDVIAALIWASLWVMIGYVVGDRYPAVGDQAGTLQLILVVLLLISIAGFVLLRRWSRRRGVERTASTGRR